MNLQRQDNDDASETNSHRPGSLASAETGCSEWDGGLESFQASVKLSGGAPTYLRLRAWADATSGRRHQAQRTLAQLTVGAQWELPGAVARRDQSHALGFLLNPPVDGHSVRTGGLHAERMLPLLVRKAA